MSLISSIAPFHLKDRLHEKDKGGFEEILKREIEYNKGVYDNKIKHNL